MKQHEIYQKFYLKMNYRNVTKIKKNKFNSRIQETRRDEDN